jgi:hypothetical protein
MVFSRKFFQKDRHILRNRLFPKRDIAQNLSSKLFVSLYQVEGKGNSAG